MNWDVVQSLGIGGTFAVVVLFMVFNFLDKKKANGSGNSTVNINKNGCVSRTEFEKHKDVVQYKDNCTQIQKTFETRFDGMENLTKAKFEVVEKSLGKVEAGLKGVSNLIKNGE